MERHRLLWRWLESHPEALAGASVLHVAPETVLKPLLASGANYVSMDLEAPGAMVRADLRFPPFGHHTFDLLVCSHVLEHIPDDAAAIRSVRDLLAPAGVGLIIVPIDEDRESTFEDASVATPEQRLKVFGQADHVRIYGRDFYARLESAGLASQRVRPQDIASAPELLRERLAAPETLVVCSPR